MQVYCFIISLLPKFDIYVFITITRSAGGVLHVVPEGIIRSVISASPLTWFIRNIFY
jgi:hypothetical protein